MNTSRIVPFRLLDIAAILVPIALIIAACLIYVASPDFYLEYVLMHTMREYQAVEIITFGSSIAAGLVAVVASGMVIRYRPRVGDPVRRFGPALIVMSVAAASLFYGGEEVNWGQTFTQWGVPLTDVVAETNIHNRDDTVVSIQSLGSIYLIALFFVLPILWGLRQKLNIADDPAGFRLVVPRWSVIAAAAIAFLWKQYKEIYLLVVGKETARSSVFYNQFVEQINEQKEMLFAVALLMLSIQVLVGLSQAPPNSPVNRKTRGA